MKTIFLVRHGQTLFNQQHKIQGFCDSPLTDLGIQQAKVARSYLEKNGITFQAAFTSTSERAVDTLELLTDQPYERRKNLREWNFGSYEGEGEHLNPPLPYNDFFVQFGGEAQTEVAARINHEITEIAEQHEGPILIVTHGGAMANFYRQWEAHSPLRRTGPIQNCSFFRYEYEAGTFRLEEIIQHDFSQLHQ